MAEERPPALSPEALAALGAYRDATPMPDGARKRVQARLTEAAPTRPAWLWVGVGALAAAFLLWAAVGVSEALRATDDGSSSGQQAPMQAPGASGATAAVGPPAGIDSTPRPSSDPGLPAPQDESEPPPLRRPRTEPPALPRARLHRTAKLPPRPDPTPAPPPAPTHSGLPENQLGEENRLITRTWEQVRAKQYVGARRTLAEHASEFPSGVLAPERRALLVIVGCLQHPESSVEAASTYAAGGHRTLLAKVRSACDEEKKNAK